MSLIKTDFISELNRRILWYETAYKFNDEFNSISEMSEDPNLLILYGRYLSLVEMRYQIENNMFYGGFAA